VDQHQPILSLGLEESAKHEHHVEPFPQISKITFPNILRLQKRFEDKSIARMSSAFERRSQSNMNSSTVDLEGSAKLEFQLSSLTFLNIHKSNTPALVFQNDPQTHP
jgi:hypothetical protein